MVPISTFAATDAGLESSKFVSKYVRPAMANAADVRV
jgi:hypothetical protein